MAGKMFFWFVVEVIVLIVPSNSLDIASYPTFARADQTVLTSIDMRNILVPKKPILKTLEAKEKWVMLRSSYAYKMENVQCIFLHVKDSWFNVSMVSKEGTPVYDLYYKVKETEKGVEGNKSKEPLHGDIFVAADAFKNFLFKSQITALVSSMTNVMKPFTTFTFEAIEHCFD